MKKASSLIAILVLILLGACSKISDTSNLYTPTNVDTTATASLEELQQGRVLYINNCDACHHLYSPDDFSPGQWRNIMANMAPLTSLNTEEVSKVTKYLCRGN
jgi:hypothetical protein